MNITHKTGDCGPRLWDFNIGHDDQVESTRDTDKHQPLAVWVQPLGTI